MSYYDTPLIPLTEEQFRQAVRILLDKCAKLKEAHEKLLLLKGVDYELEQVLPKLAVPCTKQEGLEAAREFVESHKRVMHAYRTDAKHEKTRAEYLAFERLRGDANGAYRDVFWEEDMFMNKEEKEEYEPYSSMMECTSKNLGNLYLENKGAKDEDLLQLYMQKMLQDQPDEVKLEVLAEYHHVTEPFHVTDSKPHVILSHSSTLPVEVVAHIYSFLDLESAVRLRQVSSTWYSAFQQSNGVFKRLLNARSPWFYPDTMSWSDAALVFVSRLASPKWVPIKKIDDAFGYTSRPEPPMLLAVELDYGEKMPQCFKALDENWEKFIVDPKSLEPWPKSQKFTYTDDETIVEYLPRKNLILPPKSTFWGGYCVLPLRHHLLAETQDLGTFAFHRDGPYHWKQAHKHDRSQKELGRFFYITERKKNRDRHLWDPYREKYVAYGSPCHALPFAAHNGLIWWQKTNEANVVPTFVDLHNPKVVYYRKDKAIGVPSRGDGFFTQCQNTRFFIRLDTLGADKMGAVVYDLESRKSVLVQQPYKSLDPDKITDAPYSDVMATFWPGHVNGKFCALFMDHKTVKRYKKDNNCMW